MKNRENLIEILTLSSSDYNKSENLSTHSLRVSTRD